MIVAAMNCSAFLSLAACLCLAAAALGAADASHPAYPLWDGQETVAHYARRVNLPETQTLDLGNGVTLELVLIPAGKFIMGTPEPKRVDEEAFHKKIVTGQAVLAVGGGILLFLLGGGILRAIRERRRFQYSLRRLIGMTFAAGLCVLGGMHWWYSKRSLEVVRAEYSAAMSRFKDADDFEKPAHQVMITKPFYMGKYEVTQAQYQQVMGANPSKFAGPNLPVGMVSWDDAKEFCRKVNERTAGVSPAGTWAGGTPAIRLPTEAEWEYACRAGTTTAYYFGDRKTDLARVAWYGAYIGTPHHPVGQKEPNPWGLYDMLGNVEEWCEECEGSYANQAAKDPRQAPSRQRFTRGGGLGSNARGCRSARRYWLPQNGLFDNLGFRLMLAVPP